MLKLALKILLICSFLSFFSLLVLVCFNVFPEGGLVWASLTVISLMLLEAVYTNES